MAIRDPKYPKQVVYYDCDVKSITSALDPDDTFYYYKGKYVGTLRMSCKNGQVGISFSIDEKMVESIWEEEIKKEEGDI